MAEHIALGFVGDFYPVQAHTRSDTEINQLCATISGLNQGVDFSTANFECTILPDDIEKRPKMALQEKHCSVVERVNFDLFCLSNNHILDHKEEGLLFTQQFLQNKGFLTVGAGRDYKAAQETQRVTIKGKDFAFFNTTDASHYAAKSTRAGVYSPTARNLLKRVRAVRESVDVVVVILHSDLEFVSYPAPWKVSLSRKLAACGADIIIHHHPHVLQGIEQYGNALIAYSLGNFVFPVFGNKYMEGRNGSPDESIYLKVMLEFSETLKISYEAIPVVINKNNITQLADLKRADDILLKLERLSTELANSKKLCVQHFSECKRRMKSFIRGIYYDFRQYGFKSALHYIKLHLTTKMHTGWIKGFFSLGKY